MTKAGYEIESADRAAGIIKVTRLAPEPAVPSKHDGALYDFMSFTLAESEDSRTCSLQASVDGFVLQPDGKKVLREPSEAAEADVLPMIDECRLKDVNGILPLNLYWK